MDKLKRPMAYRMLSLMFEYTNANPNTSTEDENGEKRYQFKKTNRSNLWCL